MDFNVWSSLLCVGFIGTRVFSSCCVATNPAVDLNMRVGKDLNKACKGLFFLSDIRLQVTVFSHPGGETFAHSKPMGLPDTPPASCATLITHSGIHFLLRGDAIQMGERISVSGRRKKRGFHWPQT